MVSVVQPWMPALPVLGFQRELMSGAFRRLGGGFENKVIEVVLLTVLI